MSQQLERLQEMVARADELKLSVKLSAEQCLAARRQVNGLLKEASDLAGREIQDVAQFTAFVDDLATDFREVLAELETRTAKIRALIEEHAS